MNRLRKFIRILTVFLISCIGLLVLLFVFINLPFSDRFVSRQVNGLFNKLELPLHIQSIRTVLPPRVKVEGVTIKSPEGDTIISAMDLDVKIKLRALLKKKVKLKEAYMSGVLVHLSNDTINQRINIARAFSNKDKPREKKPKEEKDFWEIDIKRGDLQYVSFLLKDPLTGIHIFEEVENLKLQGFNLSLLERSLIFKSIDLKSALGGVEISPRRTPPKEKKRGPWNFGFKKVQMADFEFTFDQQVDSLLLKLNVGEGLIRTRVTDFANKELDVDLISLSGAEARILTGLKTESSSSSSNLPSTTFPWDFIIDKTDLEKVNVYMNQYSEHPDSGSYISGITRFDMQLIDTRLNDMQVGVVIKKLNFDLANGFSIRKVKGELSSNSESSHLDLSLATAYSQLEIEASADSSFGGILANPAEMRNAQVYFYNTELSLRDAFFFKKGLDTIPSFTSLAETPISIEGSAGLNQSRINLSDLAISQAENFSIDLTGSAANAFHPLSTRANLKFEVAALDSVWLNEIMKELGVGKDSSTLTSFFLSGSISDSLGYSGVDLGFKSNLGDIDLSGTFDLKNESYDLFTTFDRLLPGTLMGVEALGEISGSGTFSGGGFKQDSLSASISLVFDSLTYNNYQYSSLSITAGLSPGFYEFSTLVDDPNLKTELFTTITRLDSIILLNANGTLFAQLDQLHLSNDTLSIESNISASLSKTQDALESELILEGIGIGTALEQIKLDMLQAVFASDSSQTHLAAQADFFETDILIGEALENLDSLKHHYRSYLSTFVDSSHSSAFTRISNLPSTNITGSISDHEALEMLIQDTVIQFTNIDFALLNNESDQSLNYTVRGSELKYNHIEIGELDVSAIDSAGIMNVQMLAKNNNFFEEAVNTLKLDGQFSSWRGTTEFSVVDDSGKFIYNVELASAIDSNMLLVTIPKKQLIINRDQWELDQAAVLSLNLASKMLLPSLKMYTDSSEIHIYSDQENGQHSYYCELDRVFLQSLMQGALIPGDPHGSISGEINYVMNEDASRSLNTDLVLNNPDWYEVGFDTISLKGHFNSDSIGSYELDILSRLDSANINFQFKQLAEDSRSLITSFTSLPLIAFRPFVRQQLSELGGNISGDFSINSDNEEEEINGNLEFNNASLRINTLNSKFRIPDEKVQFSGERMVFKEFEILDSLNNTLDVNGFIDIDHNWQVSTDLNVQSSGIQVMHRSGNEKEAFYGDNFLDSHLSIKGPLSSPIIKGKLLLARGSELFYRYLEDLSLSESAKYVNFVSSRTEGPKTPQFSEKHSKIFESSIETLLEIDPSTRINFSVSKWAFDIDLGITGGGSLNFQMLNNNQYSLSGRYLINNGEADLKLVGWPNKNFQIARNSYIGWDGRIDNPELKIEASNRVNTSYTNPVDGKQRTVDVDVILNLSSQLSSLDVGFTIFTTDQYLMSIINTLSKDEQMRQAITILLFETVDLPGISNASSTNYMTQQVNSLVSSQLNSLTKTTIKGIDISFGVNTYVQATEGGAEETKTSLSYDVKKKFMDDRAEVKVSGRMNDLYQQSGASNFTLNNISLEYQLDSAASRYLKVYNERSYEDVFEGEVVKTGVGITFRKRYWTIREIWRRKEKEKK